MMMMGKLGGGGGRIIHAYMFSEIYFILRELLYYIIAYFPQVYINAYKKIKQSNCVDVPGN